MKGKHLLIKMFPLVMQTLKQIVSKYKTNIDQMLYAGIAEMTFVSGFGLNELYGGEFAELSLKLAGGKNVQSHSKNGFCFQREKHFLSFAFLPKGRIDYHENCGKVMLSFQNYSSLLSRNMFLESGTQLSHTSVPINIILSTMMNGRKTKMEFQFFDRIIGRTDMEKSTFISPGRFFLVNDFSVMGKKMYPLDKVPICYAYSEEGFRLALECQQRLELSTGEPCHMPVISVVNINDAGVESSVVMTKTGAMSGFSAQHFEWLKNYHDQTQKCRKQFQNSLDVIESIKISRRLHPNTDMENDQTFDDALYLQEYLQNVIDTHINEIHDYISICQIPSCGKRYGIYPLWDKSWNLFSFISDSVVGKDGELILDWHDIPPDRIDIAFLWLRYKLLNTGIYLQCRER